ncbi:hypothetical protein HMN09_00695200 [Mycena chlorophos]|uniref:MATH domain-containing protein n=1 Tax=Mycena chlorophos TaxID=658473 RepID=A0A8H6WBB0_MYCCL|nr:hypothetical protein HMN09_00695200 [Mycena chlorophos]
MILPSEDKTLDDAPPTYEASTSASAAGPSSAASAVAGPSALRYPTDSKQHPSSPSSASSPSLKTPPPTASSSTWFGFTTPAARQVRQTVLGLVRDLVQLADDGDAASALVTSSVLKSCSEACTANGLSISSLLQEPSVEGHTPLYWAIVKRNSSDATTSENLLTTLLSLSSPLTPATISDPFSSGSAPPPDFSPLSPTDQLILDASSTPDRITVENVPNDEFAFGVDFSVVRFQTRMRVSKKIELDFIARGRMWRLAFCVVERRRPHFPPPGTWYISLSLLDNSPPTWIDSRVLVPAPADATAPATGASTFGSGFFGSGKSRPRPTLSVRLKAVQQLYSTGHRSRREIVAVLDEGDGENGLGTLQYAGCPYIQPDESLHFRFEARLARPEAECIIC